MSLFRRRVLDEKQLHAIVDAVIAHGEAGRWAEAWKAARPLVKAQAAQVEAAGALVHLLEQGVFEQEPALACAAQVLAAHRDHLGLVGSLGLAAESLHDLRYLNDAPPEHPVFAALATRLGELVETGAAAASDEDLVTAVRGLAMVARLLGRSWDETAERAARRSIELEPEAWQRHYDLGLFYKTRGRFAEGQAENQRAWDLGGSDDEGVAWNLGICATGARDGAAALRVWKGLGQTTELGRFGLPDGPYPATKVRLAQRPLAERRAGEGPDDPGAEETIWVERLSPCHGIVRSALFNDALGVDYGDVVLFDGAPITHHEVAGARVPVFPQLTTLERRGYAIHHFVGTQERAQQLAGLSDQLPHDAVIYVHTEQVTHVRGKLCAPPALDARAFLAALDTAIGGADVHVYAPTLARAAGDEPRAEIETRRLAMIEKT